MSIRKFTNLANESDSRFDNLKDTIKLARIAERFDDSTENDNPYDDGIQYLNRKLDECIDSINTNRGKSTFPGFGTSSSTTLRGNTTTISTSQASAITANTTKANTAHGWGNHASAGYLTRSAPGAPSSLSTSIVNDTIDLSFNKSSTSNIDYYLVFNSIDGSSDYGLISVIDPADFGNTMSVIDSTFSQTGTMAYRVYAVKNGVYSSAATTSKAFTISSLEPTNMSVTPLNKVYFIQWDPPSTKARFVSNYKIYKHAHATQSSLSRSSASLIYTGKNTNYMYPIVGGDKAKYHQFWVEITVA